MTRRRGQREILQDDQMHKVTRARRGVLDSRSAQSSAQPLSSCVPVGLDAVPKISPATPRQALANRPPRTTAVRAWPFLL
eukprot:5161973-Pleurochrysis_carterae.AAC.4